jgi:GMP synthase (glutamine-hydrolysing)
MLKEHRKILLVTFRDTEAMRRLDLAGIVKSSGCRPEDIVICDAVGPSPSPDFLVGMDAVILGGSGHSVFEEYPNRSSVEEFVHEVRRRHLPILGICFGHQLLAHVFGGEVVRDDACEEYGTFDVRLAPAAAADPLFVGLPAVFPAQCAHRDRVARLPVGATLLASSAKCLVHAFTLPGEGIYGVQFHLERSRADFEAVIRMSGPDYAARSGGAAAALSTLRETPEAASVIARFVEQVTGR